MQKRPKEELDPKHGKKPNQKLKPYLVMNYLLRNSDENHVVSAPQICGYLQEAGIDAERRSIYRDIEEINKAMLMVEQDMYLDEAEEEIEKYGDDARYIIYDANKKGFYVRERRYELDEIRLAAEGIYAYKFLTEKETETLIDLVCSFVSKYQSEQIKHEVFLAGRVKTNNKYTFRNISTIQAAMSKSLDGENHVPEKISFKYMKYSISDVKKQVEKRKGERYKVSPFALLLNEGNYYLFAFDDKQQAMRQYRLDRMRDVQLTGEQREGDDAFSAIDLETYTQRVFLSFYTGNLEHVTLRFSNRLLDAVIDRFGTDDAMYIRDDDDHFIVSATADINMKFFAWICGFEKMVEIVSPAKVKTQFIEYLDRIRNLY